MHLPRYRRWGALLADWVPQPLARFLAGFQGEDRVSALARQAWGSSPPCGRAHFNEVTLESSVAPSGRAIGLRAAKAIASIPIAKSEMRMAFALSHLSNSCGFLG